MQTEAKNPRSTGNSNLPTITLVALVGLIAALLYVGYDYFVDNTEGSDELTNVALDTTSQQPLAQNDPDMLMAPDEADNSTLPAPVDLSQATPPADAPKPIRWPKKWPLPTAKPPTGNPLSMRSQHPLPNP